MCFAIRVGTVNGLKTVSFLQAFNQLSALDKHQKYTLPWGRKPGEPGRLPLGGGCRYDFLTAGKFDSWFPKKVVLSATAFAIRDMVGRVHWFTLSAADCLQGLVLKNTDERRIYLLMALTQRTDNLFWYWPEILHKYGVEHFK